MANDNVKLAPGPASGADAPPVKPTPPTRRAIALAVTGALLCVGFFYGLRYALNSFTHESTDDAFLESHVITVAPRVAGQVLAVHVKENQRVKQGEPLLEIDPRDYEIQLAHKRAAHASADANLASAQAGIELVKARFETAQATELQEQATADASRAKADRAEAFFKRAQSLRNTKVMSDEEFDRARADAQSATADFRAAEQKAAASKSQVGESRAQITVAKSVLD
ncbi:MAG TPA: biotin/lipoyl-binding protein, partial [Verrucomicrobiae bacterium]|nr:biotin/lipoyl-binding protein [Verrucomicrobiae bacterium]